MGDGSSEAMPSRTGRFARRMLTGTFTSGLSFRSRGSEAMRRAILSPSTTSAKMVAPVETRDVGDGDEELARAAVGIGIARHADRARPVVQAVAELGLEAAVGLPLAVVGAVVVLRVRVAPLDDEVRDHAVQRGAVVEAGGDRLLDVAHVAGGVLRQEAPGDIAERGAHDGDLLLGAPGEARGRNDEAGQDRDQGSMTGHGTSVERAGTATGPYAFRWARISSISAALARSSCAVRSRTRRSSSS